MTGHQAQDDVERALQAAGRGDCVVIAEETSSANLRWADNTLTTNGVQRSRRLTVIAIGAGRQGPAVGVVSRAGARPDKIPDLGANARRPPADGSPAPDAQLLIGTPPGPAGPGGVAGPQAGSPGWDDPASATGASVLGAFAGTLGKAFAAAAAARRRLYGFAEHSVTSQFLGSSTGLRLRHDQPDGRAELNAKSADLTRSAWTGAATRDFTDVRQLPGLAAAAGGGRPLDHVYPQPRSAQRYRGGQAVRPAAHDHRVSVARHDPSPLAPAPSNRRAAPSNRRAMRAAGVR